MAESDIITVDQSGDVLLHFQDSNAQVDQQFRCSRNLLGQNSRYFDVLFDPNKFSEGKEVESKLDGLLKQYGNVASIPSDCLPVVVLGDIGEVPPIEDYRVVALFIFLGALHGETFKSSKIRTIKMRERIRLKEGLRNTPLQALTRAALLVILAEKFAATEAIRHYLHEMDWRYEFNGHAVNGASPDAIETNNRRKVLVGMFMGNEDLVKMSSSTLIFGDFAYWSDDIASSNASIDYRLPRGIEGEKGSTI